MPPANSPNETPPYNSSTSTPYLQQLETISSPVPDLAATLVTSAEEVEVNDSNVSFLRTRLPIATERRSDRTDPDESIDRPTDYEYWAQRAADRSRALRRESASGSGETGLPRDYILRPYHRSVSQSAMSRQAGEDGGNDSYTDRTPHRQSLYDWAPVPFVDEGDNTNESRADDLEEDLPSNASYARYRWQERTNHLDQTDRNESSRRIHPQPRDEPSGRTTVSNLSEAIRSEVASRRDPATSIRAIQRSMDRHPFSSTEALLRSIDRHRRSQNRAYSRSVWQNYIPASLGDDENSTTSTRLHRSEHGDSVYRRTESDVYIPNTRSALRQKFEDPSLRRVKEVMQYLSELRHCSRPRDAMALSRKHCLFSIEVDSLDSWFLSDLNSTTVTESSWLVPGATFCGSQSASLAAGEGQIYIHHPHDRDDRRDYPSPYSTEDLPLRESESTHLTVTTSTGRTYIPERTWDTNPSHRRRAYLPHVDSVEGDQPNCWPVSVTIDTLDLPTMTLTGTMSASQIRDKRSPTGESSSTTYFDGEIIDFKTHSLETQNFESEGIETDVLYWMKIGPFRNMDESTIAHNLLKRRWVEGVLLRKWILMRWKERSFVPPNPSPNPGGISIRGFYYIALNRQTGEIDGSYGNHPESQPYQRLRMKSADVTLDEKAEHGRVDLGVRKWWPAVGMR